MELAIKIEMLYQQAQWNGQIEIHSAVILQVSAIDQNGHNKQQEWYHTNENIVTNMGDYNKK